MLRRACVLTLALLAIANGTRAADLKPDAATAIPEDAKRPVVISLGAAEVAKLKTTVPKASLPEGWELVTATAAPLVTHPIMGCLDDKGRLFIGDAVGLNWNKTQLEANPPNRVLLLEDLDHDGFFEKSTVFADRMTFPQGAVWLKGSLYVASPPGIWKLTDVDGDGVAEQREMIVGGFEYTGNAADVHGPFLHPNGRLYWCHGRKGHKVIQKDGGVVHEGLASGIWSCLPDGTDVQWHALSCADNPTEIDFTPEGEIIGTCNLYYSQPRGDTLMHWLYGGVYERPDMMKAITGLPRTLERMPVMHNFGHVAVSGCTFARHETFRQNNAEATTLQMFVTHFNTQRVVRMELTPDGATYKATEHEFLRLPDSADVHFTDVMEDAKGDLLVVNTGGWFRIGCPSSLLAKPEMKGAIYRVRKKQPPPVSLAAEKVSFPAWKSAWQITSEQEALDQLGSSSVRALVQACDWAACTQTRNAQVRDSVIQLLKRPGDPILEHASMHAVQSLDQSGGFFLSESTDDDFSSRYLIILAQRSDPTAAASVLPVYAASLNPEKFPQLAEAIRRTACTLPSGGKILLPIMEKWLQERPLSPTKLKVTAEVIKFHLQQPGMQKLAAEMLASDLPAVRRASWDIVSAQPLGPCPDAWMDPLGQSLASARDGDVPLLLEAIAKLKTDRFNETLQAMASETTRPRPVRLRAMSILSRGGSALDAASFTFLTASLQGMSSVPARIDAARVLGGATLSQSQLLTLAACIPTLGPIELQEMLKLVRKTKDAATIKSLAAAFAKSPVIGSIEESVFKTTFASALPEAYDLVAPAIREAAAATEAKKRRLESLVLQVQSSGRPGEGRAHFIAGKGTCIACHKIGDAGRALGPDISKVGSIRTERDLLESILFPSNTLARDYETHAIETSDGQNLLGLIRSHTAEGLLLVDLAGQEKNVPHTSIVANTTLTTSLMPLGLDATMTPQELCDLVAWLRSLK